MKGKKIIGAVIKTAAFILVFCLIFSAFQKRLHYRWPKEQAKFVQYDKTNGVDIVFLGSSEIWSAVVPMVLYGESGITSFNLGHPYHSSLVFYNEVKYVIEKHSPEYIAMDFSSLYSNRTPKREEDVYRTALYAIPDKRIRRDIIRDIWRLDRAEAITFQFPLFRFHSMWSDPEEIHFSREPDYEDIEMDYYLGWHNYENVLCETTQKDYIKEITPDMWEVEESGETISDFDREYLEKTINLCKENNVRLIAVIPPKYNAVEVQAGRWNTTEKFFKDNGIDYFYYNTYELNQQMGMDWDADYYDEGHLNYVGAIKWSKQLAADLAEYGLVDHRNDNSDLSWQMDEWLRAFNDEYANLPVEGEN